MKHFLFERSEYRINPQFRNPHKRPLSMGLHTLSRLRLSRGGGGGSSRGRTGGGYTPDTRQRCTVKMHYSKSMQAHLKQINEYLIREGAGRAGKGAELYGTPEQEYRAHMADKNFRIFLSPGSNNVPLEALTKTFMKKLELQTGYQLYWVAADHHNTAHNHTHILINGTDKNGRDVFFPRDLVKTLMRESARDICTSLIGPRSKADMAMEKQAVLTANRYTYLDDTIKTMTIEQKIDCGRILKDRDRYTARLDHLRTLGLCDWKDGSYVLASGWEETLKTVSRYNTFLDARKRYKDGSRVVLYESAMGKRTGVITKIYKTDEVSDNHAVLLESADGKSYFIPLFRKPAVREGEAVEVMPKRNERGRLSPELVRGTQSRQREDKTKKERYR